MLVTMPKPRTIALRVLAPLAAVVLLLLVLPKVPLFTEVLRRAAERRAGRLLGAPVRIARVRLAWLPLSIRAEDVGTDRTGNRGSEGHLTIESIEMKTGWLSLLRLRRGAARTTVVHPRLKLLLAEGRPFSPGGGAAGTPELLLAAIPPGSTLTINGAEMEIASINGPSARLTGLRIEARYDASAGAVHGTLEFTGGALHVPSGDWDPIQGDGAYEATARGLRFDPLSVRGPGFAVAWRGAIPAEPAGGATADGEARIDINLEALARFLPAEAAPRGRVEGRLSGAFRDGRLTAQGDLKAVAIGLWGMAMDSVLCDLEIGGGLRLKGIRAHLLGGEASGAVELAWTGGIPRGSADLRVDGVDLAQVLEYAGWSGPPLRGTVHYRGRHEIRGTSLEGARGSGVLDAVGHYVSPRGVDLPLEVTSTVEAEGASVRLTGGTLRAGSVRGNFSGTVSRADGFRLRLRGATGDISEILPLFATPGKRPGAKAGAAGPGAALPVRLVAWTAVAGGESALERLVSALGGRWEWDGDLHYVAGRMSFAGSLAGDGLTFKGRDLGSLRATVDFRDEILRIQEATFRLPERGEVRLGGEVAFRGEGSIAIEAAAADCPIGDLLAVVGLALPIDGRLSGRISVSGRPQAPAGRAWVESGPLRVAGMTFEALKGDLMVTPDLLEVRGLTLTQPTGRLGVEGRILLRSASGFVLPAGESPPHLAVAGSGIDLSAWSDHPAGLALRGTVAVEGSIGGALDAPVGSITARAADLGLGGVAIGALTAEAGFAADAVTLGAELPAQRLRLEGRVELSPGTPVELRATFDGTELRGEMLRAGVLEEATLTLSGEASLSGPLARPREIAGYATLRDVACAVAGVALTAQGPVDLSLESGRLRLGPTVLAGDGTRVEMSGEVEAGPAGRVQADARGTFDLRLLRPFMKNLQASGRGEIVLKVGGARDDPDLEGSLQIAAEAIRYPDLPFPVGDLQARLGFEGATVRIESLHFLAGGGPVEGSGEVQVGPAGGDGGPPSVRHAEVRFEGKDVKAEFPEGFRSASDFDVTLRIGPDGAVLSGGITLVKGVYSRDFRIESSLVRGRGGNAFGIEPPQGPLRDLKLDLEIQAAREVWLRNDFGSMEGSGHLLVRGTAARPSVAGRITAAEGGTLRFRNVRYRVQSGTVDFADPEAINPRFDMVAETTVAEYQVTLRVEGTLDDFRYELTSAPPLPQPDIVSLLLTGRTLGTFGGAIGPEGQALAEESVTAYLYGRLSDELSQRLAGRAGIDVLAIDPMQVNGQGDPSTRVTIGKQVTPDLLVTYSDELGSNQGSIYQLDYSLGRDFKLTTVRDRDGSIGGDIKYVLRGAPPALPGLDGRSAAAAPPVLAAIRIEGHARFKESTVRHQLRLKTGHPLDRAAVNDGVDRLLAFYRDRGYLMAEVDYEEARGREGQVDLAVRVQPGLRIDIRFEGTGNQEGLRQRVTPYWQKGIFLDDIVEQARERILSHFRDRGYQSAKVTARTQGSDEESFRVLFSVERGPRVQAEEVRIAGARQIDEKELRKALRTRPDTAFGRGIVRESRLGDDVAAIHALYLARGFPEVVVPQPEVLLDESGSRASVVFHVDEGPRVTLGRVVFEGNEAFPSARLESIAALPPGSAYTQEAAEAAAIRLRRLYDDAGYPDVRVGLRRVPGTGDETARRDEVVFSIQEGANQSVGAVEVSGNLITHEEVIREALAVKPHHTLSRADLLASQTRLYRRGIFNSVAVEIEPRNGTAGGDGAAGADGISGGARTVRVTVREAPPLTQVFGIGYDSEEKARGQYEISNRNIFGTGRYLGLQTRASSVQERASLLFREAGVFGGRFDAQASAFWEDEERPAFDVRSIGSSIQIARQPTRATRALYRYSLKDVDLSDASADFEGTTLRLSSLAASLVHDTRDAPFDPLRGHYLSGEVSLYARGLGSEAEFTKLYGQVLHFREVLPRTVWAQAIRAGAAIPFGRSERDPTLTGDALSGVPPSERFFAGGDTTVRGFRRDRLGPVDVDGAPVGGEGVFLLNEELRFPIFRTLQGVVFYDAGNVYRTLDDYDPTDLRHVAGAGLRLSTPIGPFRFEYGALLDRKAGEGRGEFFISIGQAF
jgi:outer membrane protein assembly complex protein YaeT